LITDKKFQEMVKIIISKKLAFIFFLFLLSCSQGTREIDNILISVKEHFVPDSRVAIFEVELLKSADGYQLKGETDQQNALRALLDSLDRLQISVLNEVQILPQKQLNGRHWGLVNISVCNIRKEPRHSAELVTQGILGTPVKVFKKKGSWFLIQTPDRYLGWVDGGGIEWLPEHGIEAYIQKEKIIFTGIYGFSYQNPEKDSGIISDLTSGNVLFLEEKLDSHYKVSYPDGRLAYVRKSESRSYEEWLSETGFDPDKLTVMANRMLGFPYLWGGTSSKGMDCSGFTKTVYLMNGYVLPRDASQQVNIGTLVDDKMAFEVLKKGDLLFFGRAATDSTDEKVVHVGMWIGDMKFIHASGDIHLSSMDPASDIFDEYNLNRYLRTKRLAGSADEDKLLLKTHGYRIWQ
jgi:hypothetical protein